MWVLLLIGAIGSAGYGTHGEFTSKEKCEAAVVELTKAMGENRSRAFVWHVCVEK